MTKAEIINALVMEFGQSYKYLPVRPLLDGAARLDGESVGIRHDVYSVKLYEVRRNAIEFGSCEGFVPTTDRQFRRRKDGTYNIGAIAEYLAGAFNQAKLRDSIRRDWFTRFLAEIARLGLDFVAVDAREVQFSLFQIKEKHLKGAIKIGTRGLADRDGNEVIGLAGNWTEDADPAAGPYCYLIIDAHGVSINVNVYIRRQIASRLANAAAVVGEDLGLSNLLLRISDDDTPEETVRKIAQADRDLHNMMDRMIEKIAVHNAALEKSTELVEAIGPTPGIVKLSAIPDPEHMQLACSFVVESATRGHVLDLLDKIRAIQEYADSMGLKLSLRFR